MAMHRLAPAPAVSITDALRSWANPLVLLSLLLMAAAGQAQIVEAFDIRYQTQQNGGIVFLANSTMYCGGGNTCTQTQQAMPSSNWSQDNNNDHNMVYYDGDNDPDTWCSSSDSLALGLCADVSFAGLYWAGRLGNGFVPNEALRDQVEIRSADDQPYIVIEADEEIEFDASGVDNYCCFADITTWMQQQPINARVTVANVIADEDDSSWGGWVLILVYADALEPMRNLTVFDGLARLSGPALEDALRQAEEVILDRNKLAEGKAFCKALATTVSLSGKMMAYRVECAPALSSLPRPPDSGSCPPHTHTCASTLPLR